MIDIIEIKTGLLLWKVSNLWQNKLRNVLQQFSLTINEFLVLETLHHLKNSKINITQVYLSKSSGIDISVISVVLKSLNKKILVYKQSDKDNRKNIIKLTNKSIALLKNILPLTNEAEKNFFDKLKKEESNFSNSLKLILGKKLRIKAERYEK